MTDLIMGSRHKWPAVAPVDGSNLATQAIANAESLLAQTKSPDTAAEVASDILADLHVAELFAKPNDELIIASMLLGWSTRTLAFALRRSSGPQINLWRDMVCRHVDLVRSIAKGEGA